MTKKLFMTAMSLLVLLGAACSCTKEGGVDRGDINAAIKLTATHVTATSAVISGVCAQDNVAGCYYVSPFLTSEAKFVDMDAIQKKAYILEHGTRTEVPFEFTLTGKLNPGTDYTVAVIGYDEAGVFRTAPYYTTFKTGKADVKVTAEKTGKAGAFVYKYKIEPGEFTTSFKYIVSTDSAVGDLEDSAVAELLKKGGADVKTSQVAIENEISSAKEIDLTVAAIPYDEGNNEGAFAIQRALIFRMPVITVENDLKMTSANYYEGVVKLQAKTPFGFKFEGKQYGFIPYSGNGGVGTVENEFAAVPYYNVVKVPECKYMFQVEKACGRLAEITEDPAAATPLWTNMAADADVKVVFDKTYSDGIPRYYLEIVNTDEKRVFYEGFDLFVYGAFFQAPVKGTFINGAAVAMKDVPCIDGTEPGIHDAVNTTTNGIVPMTYGGPVVDPDKDGQPTATFIKNRGLEGWQLKRISEFPGFAQLGNSQTTHFEAYFITPKMSKLTAATNVVLETAAYRFAGSGDIKLAILGAGKFTSAKTSVVTGTKAKAGEYKPGSVNLSETEFTITGDILPKEDNADKNKSILKISIEVEGATAETQFKFYVPEEVTGKDGRIQFDYVKVTKK